MPNSLQNDEISFISGVNADGSLPTRAYYGWNNATPAAFNTGYTDSRKWGTDTAGTGATVTYYLDPRAGWTAAETNAFTAGLALWSAVANINFVAASSGDGANITILRGTDGSATTITSATDKTGNAGTPGGTHLLTMTGATTSISTGSAGYGPIDGTFSTGGGSPLMAILHEEGHALGLGHAGPYNSAVTSATQQNGAYDNKLWSVMSYIASTDTSAAYYGQDGISGTNWNGNVPTTWMPLDILAIQRLYGVANSTPLSGGQTFGFNSNVTGVIAPFFDFAQNTNPVVTLWDKGSNNTLDLSGFSAGSTVNLNAGSFSSVDGMTNNIAIAYGTSIDTVILGNGTNTVACNDDGDNVCGGSGNDTITGGAGNDIFNGGAGTNLLYGGGGYNTADFSGPSSAYAIVQNGDGSTTVSGLGSVNTLYNIQKMVFAAASTDFNGDGGSDIVWQNDNGQAAIWTMNGMMQSGGSPVGGNPGTSWHLMGSNDFDGDGKADLFWQNTTTGQAAIWTMNGMMQTSGAIVGGNPGPTWHVMGSADFDGDGKADILWQNTSTGQAAIWTMNGLTQTGGAIVGGNPGTAWHIKGTGDFDGDGKADILWQNDNGAVAIWTMNGLTQTGGAIVGGNPGPTWHVKGVGDFNGDGKDDILWQSDNGQAAIWTMNGLSQIGGAQVGGNPGTNWSVKSASDFNHDGKADILWQNGATGQVAVWTMSGFTQLGSTMVGGTPGSSWHIATAGG